MKYLFLISVFLISCKILPGVKPVELFSAKTSNKNAQIKVLYFPSNATIQSSIQVQKITNNKIEVIKDFERYNFMDTCRLINDSMLLIVIRDTISILGNKPDTMRIRIK